MFTKKTQDKQPKASMKPKDFEQLGRYMLDVYETAYTSKKRLFYMSFVKCIGQGFGIFIGGTIVVAFVFWVLGIFDDTFLSPVIQRIYNAIQLAESKQAPTL